MSDDSCESGAARAKITRQPGPTSVTARASLTAQGGGGATALECSNGVAGGRLHGPSHGGSVDGPDVPLAVTKRGGTSAGRRAREPILAGLGPPLRVPVAEHSATFRTGHGGPGGRGRAATLPAWMTAEAETRSHGGVGSVNMMARAREYFSCNQGGIEAAGPVAPATFAPADSPTGLGSGAREALEVNPPDLISNGGHRDGQCVQGSAGGSMASPSQEEEFITVVRPRGARAKAPHGARCLKGLTSGMDGGSAPAADASHNGGM